jgi:hypothetical protein
MYSLSSVDSKGKAGFRDLGDDDALSYTYILNFECDTGARLIHFWVEAHLMMISIHRTQLTNTPRCGRS